MKLSSIEHFSIFSFIDDFNCEGCPKSHKRWTCNKSKYQTCLRVLRKRNTVFRYLLIPLSQTTIRLRKSFVGMTTFFHICLSSINKIMSSLSHKDHRWFLYYFLSFLSDSVAVFCKQGFFNLATILKNNWH